MNSNLIIVSQLSIEPLSDGLYFRYLTLVGKTQLQYNILLEADKKATDFYWKYLKRHGWFDFVEDFVQPEWKEEGIRIDRRSQPKNPLLEINYPKIIRVDSIRCENTLDILGQLKGFGGRD